MEDLALGDHCAKPSSFEAEVLCQGSFIARIKRTGTRTLPLGDIELLLVESKVGTEQLAVCYSDGEPQNSRTLIFPLIKGTEFGVVKRHGNVLTLHAVRFSLILEACSPSSEVDPSLSATTGQWARILSRLVSGHSGSIIENPSESFKSQKRPFYGGLGISVSPPAQEPSSLLNYTSSNASMNRSKQLVPKALQEADGHQEAFSSFMGTRVPQSKSLKRISLCLQNTDGEASAGFGNDLFSVLSKMDTPSPEVQPETFALPAAPFSENQDTVTPSPNTLYLQADGSLSSVSSLLENHNLKRVDTILAKEQQQYVENYGSRAQALSMYFDIDSSPSLPTEAPSGSIERQPPQIPAPVIHKSGSKTSILKPAACSVKSSDSFSSTSAPAPHLPKSLSANRIAKFTSKTSSIKDSQAGNAKTGPVLRKTKAVSVAIDPNVYIINDSPRVNEEENDTSKDKTDEEKDVALDTCSTSKRSSNKPKLSKVVKRLLGKRKVKDSKQHKEQDKASEVTNNSYLPSPLDQPLSPREKSADISASPATHNIKGKEIEEPSSHGSSLPTPEGSPATNNLRTPESINLDGQSHHYLEFAIQEAPTPALPVDNCFEKSKQICVANSNSNSGLTAAVPKLRSSNSIAALSFRSLSSKSLSLDAFSTDLNNANELKKDKQESTTNTKAELEPVSELDSPVLMKREQRDELNIVPIKIDTADLEVLTKPDTKGDSDVDHKFWYQPSASRKMYESGNKSTSAVHPSNSSSFSSFASSKRSINSSGFSFSSASSFSTPTLLKQESSPDSINLFGANMWASVWANSRWNPLSQLELRTEIVATNSSTVAKIVVNGGADVNLQLTPECEVRKVGHHDVEVKALENTYMFRARDPENSQRFYRTLWTIQANGVQPIVAAAASSSMCNEPYMHRMSFYEDDELALRRRTLMPPTLSRSNPKLNLTYMGRAASTIIEE